MLVYRRVNPTWWHLESLVTWFPCPGINEKIVVSLPKQFHPMIHFQTKSSWVTRFHHPRLNQMYVKKIKPWSGIRLVGKFSTDSIPWYSSPLFTTIWENMFGTVLTTEQANLSDVCQAKTPCRVSQSISNSSPEAIREVLFQGLQHVEPWFRNKLLPVTTRRWWFQISVIFHPYLAGKWSNLTNIFFKVVETETTN